MNRFTSMNKKGTHFSIIVLTLVFLLFTQSRLSAEIVELKGKINLVDNRMPGTVILHSTADESFMATATIDKDGNFSFKVDVPVAGLYNFRFLRFNYDVMLSAAEKTTNVSISIEGNNLKDIDVENSPENDAYKAFKEATGVYDPKIKSLFSYCEGEDSCQKVLHRILTDYARELTGIQQKYKKTYTAEMLCRMRMPVVSKNTKATADDFRKGFFENVNFSDSTIFCTPVYSDMINAYVDYLVEPSISKENLFVKYFTDKIKANPVVFHKSAGIFFDALFRAPREKMLGMFIDWYNTGDNKTAVNNPVMDVKLKNISKVMPGQPYIDAKGPDTAGAILTLKDVVDHSKCTMLLFWSSDCSHCRAEMPYIKEYYEKYHSKGLNIYAVSLENNFLKWKSFIEENKLSWTNVMMNRMDESNPAMQYVATTTPTMILIDNKGKILHRFIPKSKLESHIIEALK